MSTKFDARQAISRDLLARLAGSADQELDNLLRSIDAEVTPSFEMSASATPNLIVTIADSTVSNPETDRQKGVPAITEGMPRLGGSGTVTFPAASGGTIVVSPGNNKVLTCTAGNYAAVLIYMDDTNNLNVLQGVQDATLLGAIDNLLPSPSKTLGIGFVVVHNIAGTIQNIQNSDIYQFGTGSGSGASGTISVTAGENLTTGDAVYISKGNALGDLTRTLGQAYKLDASNDNRMEFVGFVTLGVLAGALVSVQTAGVTDVFLGLSAGVPLWANYLVPGGYTQVPPSQTGTWLIPLGGAISATEVLVNGAGAATAVYLEATTFSFTVANNTASQDVTSLLMNGASTRALKVSFSLRRRTDTALSEVVQVGEMRAWYNTQTATYSISTNYTGDDCGTTFTITAGGQVQASTTNIAGANYVGEMRYTVEQFAVGV